MCYCESGGKASNYSPGSIIGRRKSRLVLGSLNLLWMKVGQCRAGHFRPGVEQYSKAASSKSILLLVASRAQTNTAKAKTLFCSLIVPPAIVMAEDDEDIAVLLWYCWEKL